MHLVAVIDRAMRCTQALVDLLCFLVEVRVPSLSLDVNDIRVIELNELSMFSIFTFLKSSQSFVPNVLILYLMFLKRENL